MPRTIALRLFPCDRRLVGRRRLFLRRPNSLKIACASPPSIFPLAIGGAVQLCNISTFSQTVAPTTGFSRGHIGYAPLECRQFAPKNAANVAPRMPNSERITGRSIHIRQAWALDQQSLLKNTANSVTSTLSRGIQFRGGNARHIQRSYGQGDRCYTALLKSACNQRAQWQSAWPSAADTSEHRPA